MKKDFGCTSHVTAEYVNNKWTVRNVVHPHNHPPNVTARPTFTKAFIDEVQDELDSTGTTLSAIAHRHARDAGVPIDIDALRARLNACRVGA